MLAVLNLDYAREIVVAYIKAEHDPTFNRSVHVSGAIVSDADGVVIVDCEFVYKGFTARTDIAVPFSFWVWMECQMEVERELLSV